MEPQQLSEELLDKLLREARDLTRARAGTIYLRHGNELRFAIAQNDDLATRFGEARGAQLITRSPLESSERSIASYVALTRATVNIEDAYRIPAFKPYSFNRRFDIQTGFRTKSMLVMPLRFLPEAAYGVVQLINATNDRGEVIPFDPRFEAMVEDLFRRPFEKRVPSSVA
ncbi:MAG TPA: GAF domain-containing protein [Methylomirabilota bacterium]